MNIAAADPRNALGFKCCAGLTIAFVALSLTQLCLIRVFVCERRKLSVVIFQKVSYDTLTTGGGNWIRNDEIRRGSHRILPPPSPPPPPPPSLRCGATGATGGSADKSSRSASARC